MPCGDCSWPEDQAGMDEGRLGNDQGKVRGAIGGDKWPDNWSLEDTEKALSTNMADYGRNGLGNRDFPFNWENPGKGESPEFPWSYPWTFGAGQKWLGTSRFYRIPRYEATWFSVGLSIFLPGSIGDLRDPLNINVLDHPVLPGNGFFKGDGVWSNLNGGNGRGGGSGTFTYTAGGWNEDFGGSAYILITIID